MSWQYIGQSIALNVQSVPGNTLRSYTRLYLNVAKNGENQSTVVLDLNQKQNSSGLPSKWEQYRWQIADER